MRVIFTQTWVWEAALRRVCKEHQLYTPSYPIGAMSVEELRKAAIRPSLWRIRITERAQHGSDFQEKVDWEPQEKKRINLRVGSAVGSSDLYLVPGGRFLITGNSDALRLWDLGVPWAPSLRHPVLLAVARLGCPEVLQVEEHLLSIEAQVLDDRVVRVVVLTSRYRFVLLKLSWT